jgi:hypothetical protein
MPTLSLQLTFCHAFLQFGDPPQMGRPNGVPFASPIDPHFCVSEAQSGTRVSCSGHYAKALRRGPDRSFGEGIGSSRTAQGAPAERDHAYKGAMLHRCARNGSKLRLQLNITRIIRARFPAGSGDNCQRLSPTLNPGRVAEVLR